MPPSSEHSKVAFGSPEEKWKVAVALAVEAAGRRGSRVSGTTSRAGGDGERRQAVDLAADLIGAGVDGGGDVDPAPPS